MNTLANDNSKEKGGSIMESTMNDVLRVTTETVLAGLDPANPPTPAQIEAELLTQVAVQFEIENSVRDKGNKWKTPTSLSPAQTAMCIAWEGKTKRIDLTYGSADVSDYMLIGTYQEDGPKNPKRGIYDTSDSALRKLVKAYNFNMTTKYFNETVAHLHDLLETVTPCTDMNLIPVNNGIFDFSKKQLQDFSPDYVFTAKSPVNYNPNAQNVTIHNDEDGTDWDVESWISELSDDMEVVNLLWEILSAVVRPNVPWNKTLWAYSERGNNGKGSWCALARQLCGNATSIKVSEFDKAYMVEKLIRANAVICDENEVNEFIDKVANFKAICTGDPISFDRKFKTALDLKFRGVVIECMNGLPRIRDKSDAFARRQLIIPFNKCFTGAERKYIKADYLCRTEVLEYVLYKVLHMNHYEFSIPKVCEEALVEYRTFNDPVRQFVEEIVPQLQWDLAPSQFLYDLFTSWHKKNNPSGIPEGKNKFLKQFRDLMKDNSEWECSDVEMNKNHKVGNRMSVPEPLIDEYNLTDWMDPRYFSSHDRYRKCVPALSKPDYTGMVRKKKCTIVSSVTTSKIA